MTVVVRVTAGGVARKEESNERGKKAIYGDSIISN